MYEYNFDEILWNEAYEYAYQRANEEGDVDIDRDIDLIDAWAEEYYREQMDKKG